MQKNNLIFQSNGCLSEEELQLYLSGDLDDSTRFRVENHLLDCPLCSEAVEGFENANDADINIELENLKKTIDLKSNATSGSSRASVFTLNRIAAAILFLLIGSSVIIYFNAQKNQKTFLAEYQSDPLDNLRSVEADEIDEQLKEGFDYFKSGDTPRVYYFLKTYKNPDWKTQRLIIF